MAAGNPTPTVIKLGVGVTIAYASTYYLLGVLAQPMADELGLPVATTFLALSAALLLAGALGPWSGRLVDRLGGRTVLPCANVVFAAGLGLLACAQGAVSLFAAWGVLGVAMSAGFYEAVFASLVRLYGAAARPAITGVTLIAGFASTVGWPLTAWLLDTVGWRGACLAWAALHLLVALPLNLWIPALSRGGAATAQPHAAPAAEVSAAPQAHAVPQAHPAPQAQAVQQADAEPPAHAALSSAQARRVSVLLAFVFGVTWFVSTAMATHLPRLLQAHGASMAVAIGLAALVGPAQVAGRLLEYGFLRNVSPLLSARLASLAHAFGAVLFMVLGIPMGLVFTVLHGLGNGIMTVANGTLPLVFFGPAGYGARQGALMMPARFAQGLAPFVFGLAIDRLGASSLWLTVGMGACAFGALMALGPLHAAPARRAGAGG